MRHIYLIHYYDDTPIVMMCTRKLIVQTKILYKCISTYGIRIVKYR